MKNQIFTFLFCSITAVAAAQESLTRLSLTTGLSVSHLNWSIAGTSNGTNPNIYSELIWSKLKSSGFHLQIRQQLGLFRLTASYARYDILKGKATDSDYQEDNRQYRSYYGEFDSDLGFQSGWQLRGGYAWQRFTFWAGYHDKKDRFYLLDHQGQYDAHLNSTYTTHWKGLILGLDYKLLPGRLQLVPAIYYGQLNYTAKGNWNLIADFEHPVSYRHTAKGYSLQPQLNLYYRLNRNIVLLGHCYYLLQETGNGIDQLFKTNGQNPLTQLNGVNYGECGATVGLGVEF